MARFRNMLPNIHGIVAVKLHDGRVFEGVPRRMHMGNDGGTSFGNRLYGEVELHSPDSVTIVDALDIASVRSVWDQRKDAYEAAGVIQIVDGP